MEPGMNRRFGRGLKPVGREKKGGCEGFGQVISRPNRRINQGRRLTFARLLLGIYIEINETYRRRGLGAYFVQELKRIAYEMGGIPAARCSSENVASRKTLQKAGFVPFAHILVGPVQTNSTVNAH